MGPRRYWCIHVCAGEQLECGGKDLANRDQFIHALFANTYVRAATPKNNWIFSSHLDRNFPALLVYCRVHICSHAYKWWVKAMNAICILPQGVCVVMSLPGLVIFWRSVMGDNHNSIIVEFDCIYLLYRASVVCELCHLGSVRYGSALTSFPTRSWLGLAEPPNSLGTLTCYSGDIHMPNKNYVSE